MFRHYYGDLRDIKFVIPPELKQLNAIRKTYKGWAEDSAIILGDTIWLHIGCQFMLWHTDENVSEHIMQIYNMDTARAGKFALLNNEKDKLWLIDAETKKLIRHMCVDFYYGTVTKNGLIVLIVKNDTPTTYHVQIWGDDIHGLLYKSDESKNIQISRCGEYVIICTDNEVILWPISLGDVSPSGSIITFKHPNSNMVFINNRNVITSTISEKFGAACELSRIWNLDGRLIMEMHDIKWKRVKNGFLFFKKPPVLWNTETQKMEIYTMSSIRTLMGTAAYEHVKDIYSGENRIIKECGNFTIISNHKITQIWHKYKYLGISFRHKYLYDATFASDVLLVRTPKHTLEFWHSKMGHMISINFGVYTADFLESGNLITLDKIEVPSNTFEPETTTTIARIWDMTTY